LQCNKGHKRDLHFEELKCLKYLSIVESDGGAYADGSTDEIYGKIHPTHRII
jgi:hypothetical protein